MNKHYDIIISGAGLAGLSLAYRALKSGVWDNLTILIIDKSSKTTNDKTWCFWEKEQSPFEDIIFRKWDNMLFFANDGLEIVLDNNDYTYNMIRSIDFYNHTLEYLKSRVNVEFLSENINSVYNSDDNVTIETENSTFTAKYCFNSLFAQPKLKENDTFLLQHFKGIIIETPEPYFNPEQIHLMDFRTGQENGNSFFYVLPTSATTALVEYTLFSEKLLDKEIYDLKIAEYVSDVLKITDYKINERELGVIPMTDYMFHRNDGNIINIGTAGGDTRGSTGYTFSNTQKTITKILENFRLEGTPFFKEEHISRKHKIYDSTMLQVLADGKYKGHQLFSDMFSKVRTSDIFAFLDSDSTLGQDLKAIKSLIPNYFIKPFFKSLKKFYF